MKLMLHYSLTDVRYYHNVRMINVNMYVQGGTNLVAMEAFAAGIPSIISANTGHLDLIDDDRCFPLRLQYKTPRGHWVCDPISISISISINMSIGLQACD